MANERVGRARIFPEIADNANPDLTTEKYGYIDVKSPLNKSNIVRNANLACKQGAIAVITDLMFEEKLKHKQILQITEKIFSEQNRNHLGEPNYSQDRIHWFLKGKLFKYNRQEKKRFSSCLRIQRTDLSTRGSAPSQGALNGFTVSPLMQR